MASSDRVGMSTRAQRKCGVDYSKQVPSVASSNEIAESCSVHYFLFLYRSPGRDGCYERIGLYVRTISRTEDYVPGNVMEVTVV